ncbi:TetR-like C-terminal domain-containing protein [Glutamicibacter uratoxydans]|uniref:TetR-like C-terminal domain-containing protein n=1 Tax=Glutamicibacter uratoxydans TaxID=43667 RepID=UPI003D6E6B75
MTEILRTSGAEVRNGPGRPRDTELDELILKAAVELLERGEEVSVSKVVSRSGVSRAALYRRWPSITQLTAAALDVGRTQYPVIKPGDDLRRTLFASLMPAEGERFPTTRGYPTHRFFQRLKLIIDNRELQRTYWKSHVARRREPLETALQQSVDEGILRADLDVPATVDALAGVVYYQLIVRGDNLADPATRERVRHAYDTIWQGMARKN